jgi:hypothetical protein
MALAISAIAPPDAIATKDEVDELNAYPGVNSLASFNRSNLKTVINRIGSWNNSLLLVFSGHGNRPNLLLS